MTSPIKSTHYILSPDFLSSQIDSIKHLQQRVWSLKSSQNVPNFDAKGHNVNQAAGGNRRKKPDLLDRLMQAEDAMVAQSQQHHSNNNNNSQSFHKDWESFFNAQTRRIAASVRSTDGSSTDEFLFSSDMGSPPIGLQFIHPFIYHYVPLENSQTTSAQADNVNVLTYETPAVERNAWNLLDMNLSWRELMRLMTQVLRALQHSAVDFHGEITPETLVLQRNYENSRLELLVSQWGRFDWNYRIEDADAFYIERSAEVTTVPSNRNQQHAHGMMVDEEDNDEERTVISRLSPCSKYVDMYRVAAIFYMILSGGDQTSLRESFEKDEQEAVRHIRKMLSAKSVDSGIQSLLLCMLHPENNFHYDALVTYIQYRLVRDLFHSIRYVAECKLPSTESSSLREAISQFEKTHAQLLRRDAPMEEFFILQHADVLVEFAMGELVEFVEGDSFQHHLLLCIQQNCSEELLQHTAILLRHMKNRSTFLQTSFKPYFANSLLKGTASDNLKKIPFVVSMELASHFDTHQMELMVREMEAQPFMNSQWKETGGTKGMDSSLCILSESAWKDHFCHSNAAQPAPQGSPSLCAAAKSISTFFSSVNQGKKLQFLPESRVTLWMHTAQGTYQVDTDLSTSNILSLFNNGEEYSLPEILQATKLPQDEVEPCLDRLVFSGVLCRSVKEGSETDSTQYHVNSEFAPSQRKISILEDDLMR